MNSLRTALLCAALLAACTSVENAPAALPQTFALVPADDDLPGFFDCLRREEAMILSAHRGGPVPGFPENALETFAHTLSEVPALLEVDVQKTADGQLVLMHDDTLARTAGSEGEVRSMTRAELSKLTLLDNDGTQTPFRIPTLADTLAWSKGRTLLALDRKAETTYADLVEAVRQQDAFSRVVFATYSLEDAVLVSQLAPEAMIVTPVEALEDLDTLEAAGVDLAHILSWGGTEVPRPDFYAELAGRGVEAAFAPLGWWTGSWDSRIRILGDDTLYRRITSGVRLVATDRVREVAAVHPEVWRAKACVRPG